MSRARTGIANLESCALWSFARHWPSVKLVTHDIPIKSNPSAPSTSTKASHRTPRRCLPRHPKPTRSRAGSNSWPARRTGKASCARLRTCPGPRMACCEADKGVLLASECRWRRLRHPCRATPRRSPVTVHVQGRTGMGYSRWSTAGRLRSCPAAAVTRVHAQKSYRSRGAPQAGTSDSEDSNAKR
jgi:hypothetical protein